MTEVGSKVEKVKIGDKVGVGCMVGACYSCDNCANDLENYCPKMILTYGATYYDGTITYGGYSDVMVAEEHYIVRFPNNFLLMPVLLCYVLGSQCIAPSNILDYPNLECTLAWLA